MAATSIPSLFSTLRLAVAQFAPTLGNLDANLKLHLDWIAKAKAAKADLLVFPELSLTGYYLRDMVPDVAQPLDGDLIAELTNAAAPMHLILGFVEETPQFRYHNAAVYLGEGSGFRVPGSTGKTGAANPRTPNPEPHTPFIHRKVYLPTYGMFDEQRYFAAGERIRAFDTPFGRMGILICEDCWHLSCGVILQAEGIDYLICISNSPSRGVESQPQLSGGRKPPEIIDESLGSATAWRLLNRCYARFLGVVVVFANRVGYEEGVNFWGGSEILGPDGDIIEAAPEFDEALIVADVKRSELRRERIISPLGRDEKLLLTIQELDRVRKSRFEL